MKVNIQDYNQIYNNISTSENKDLFSFVRSGSYKLKEIGLTPRVVNHWEKEGLLLKNTNYGERYLLNLEESFWLKFIMKLRSFEVPLKTIKLIKENLTEVIVTSDEYLNNSDLELLKKLDITDEKANAILSFMKTAEFEKYLKSTRLNALSSVLMDMVINREYIYLLIDENGLFALYKPTDHTFNYPNDDLDQLLNKSHVSILLNEVLISLIDGLELYSMNQWQTIFTEDERKVIQTIRDTRPDTIEIKFVDKKPELIKITNNNIRGSETRLKDMILKGGYQEIKIKTQKGQIVNCVNTISIKL